MARISTTVKNEKKIKMAKRQAKKRLELKAVVSNLKSTDEEKFEAIKKLQKLSRNGSKVRVRNRCALTGRSRGYLGDFKLCRIKFRELALQGMIPGVTKSSW